MSVRTAACTPPSPPSSSVSPATLVGPDDAADVLSAAVVRALSSPRWPDVANRRAYLYQAVFSEACTWRRRGAQRPGREASLVLPDRCELPGFRPDVAEAVARLSVRQRAVVVLTYWADLDSDRARRADL